MGMATYCWKALSDHRILEPLKVKNQKVRVIGFSHPAIILVDLKFEPTVKKPLDTSGHSHSCPMAFHKYTGLNP